MPCPRMLLSNPFLVRITGTNLGNATRVLFAGDRVATFKVISDSGMKATVPGRALPGLIELETPNGDVQSPEPFVLAYQ